MGELNNTVIAGVLIFVFGQLIARFVLEPLADWRRLRGEVAHALHFYGNVYVAEGLSSPERGEEAQKHYRDLASQLWQRSHAIPLPLYRFMALLRIVPTWSEVQAASAGLTGLSNMVFEREGNVRGREPNRQRVRKALRLME